MGRQLSRTARSTFLLWQGEIPVTWFQAFNPFMIFVFTPLIVKLWAIQSRRGSEPSTVTKMAMGCFIVALSYLVMVAAALYLGPGGKSSWLWLFLYFAVITIGELYLSPVGLSLVSKVAPARILSMMMGVWLSTSFLGNFLAGLARLLLEQHGEAQLLPHDRRRGRRRGCVDHAPQ